MMIVDMVIAGMIFVLSSLLVYNVGILIIEIADELKGKRNG